MNKGKQHSDAPLQFISSHTPELCQFLLKQHLRDKSNSLLFTKIDETITEFRINYQEGSIWITAVGSLKPLMGGEQTQVTCHVQNTYATLIEPPISSGPKLKDMMDDSIINAVDSYGEIGLVFLVFIWIILFLYWLIVQIIWFILLGSFYPIALLKGFIHRVRRTNDKAVTIFYDRMTALLNEPATQSDGV